MPFPGNLPAAKRPGHGALSSGREPLRGTRTRLDERYEREYGFWRPEIRRVLEPFLECGDLPVRQYVVTIPKMLRLCFKYDRKLKIISLIDDGA